MVAKMTRNGIAALVGARRGSPHTYTIHVQSRAYKEFNGPFWALRSVRRNNNRVVEVGRLISAHVKIRSGDISPSMRQEREREACPAIPGETRIDLPIKKIVMSPKVPAFLQWWWPEGGIILFSETAKPVAFWALMRQEVKKLGTISLADILLVSFWCLFFVF